LPTFGGSAVEISILGSDVTRLVVLKSPKNTFGKTTPMSLSRHHDPVAQDNPQTFFSCRNYCLSSKLHLPTVVPCFRKGASIITTASLPRTNEQANVTAQPRRTPLKVTMSP